MTYLFQSTIQEFVHLSSDGSISNIISQKYLREYGTHSDPSEMRSWNNSLKALSMVVDNKSLSDAQIIVEMKMPLSSARCDAVLVGNNLQGTPTAVVVELKQWQMVTNSHIIDHVFDGRKNVLHPSAQVRSYTEFLKYYHKEFQEDKLPTIGCSYLHNLTDKHSISRITDPSIYGNLTDIYPIFSAYDSVNFQEFLLQAIGGGPYHIPTERLQSNFLPATKLLDALDKVIQNQFEWKLLDEQKTVFDTVITYVEKEKRSSEKFVLLVCGGPGTGKSVIALQLLAYGARRKWRIAHATGSKAFIDVLKAKTQKKSELPIQNFFTTTMEVAKYGSKQNDVFDLVVIDEAHRMWDFRRRKFNRVNQQLSKTPMIEEIINASKVVVFFIDDNQSVRADEIGTSAYIREHTSLLKSKINLVSASIDLNNQYRCSGSKSYVDWIDYCLGFSELTNLEWMKTNEYDFQIVDSMMQMENLLKTKMDLGNQCRMLAGFCWRWSVQNQDGSLIHDIYDARFGGWSAPWIIKGKQYAKPKDSRYYKWAVEEEFQNQVGSIYSAQGFEFDYIGLIFGEDLTSRNRSWKANIHINKDYVFKKELMESKVDPVEKLRNIYRVLLTRGIKGTYVFFLDNETRDHFQRSMMT